MRFPLVLCLESLALWLVWACDSLRLNQREASQKINYQLESDGHQENSGSETRSDKQQSLCPAVPPLRELALRCPSPQGPLLAQASLSSWCREAPLQELLWVQRRAGLQLAASRTLVGDGRLHLHCPILTACDHEALCFLWLVLWVNFVDLLKPTSFALFLNTSYGHSWLSHKKGCRLQSPLRPYLSVARWIL